ncbi:MAG TPA: ATP-binding cassette domain-containing protein [Chloroflexota bacterium]|nr:ATP-binding cassette domain-containing protein [Chloroflexota bacterium]
MSDTNPLAIETTGLTRRFGRQVVVCDLDLAVPRGSIYGFLGLNGAGKTTTIRLLLGLLRPHGGEVRLAGTRLDARSRGALMRRVGALVEVPSLYPHLTGIENLDVTRTLTGASRRQIERALEIVRLTDSAGQLVRTYSLGMRQRLGLALALLGEPDLLILDEPTNGLDPAGIGEMRELIRTLPGQHGITVFLSSHLLSEIEQVATHAAIIHRGRLLFQGRLAELQTLTAAEAQVVCEVDRPDAAAAVLAEAGWGVRPLPEGRLAVDAAEREAAARVNATLVGAGLRVYRLSADRPSLEEIFLRLTGETAPPRRQTPLGPDAAERAPVAEQEVA